MCTCKENPQKNPTSCDANETSDMTDMLHWLLCTFKFYILSNSMLKYLRKKSTKTNQTKPLSTASCSQM